MDAKRMQLEWIMRYPVSVYEKYAGGVMSARKGVDKKKVSLKTAKKRDRQEMVVDEEIDLHGLSIEQGLFELEKALDRCRCFKIKSLRVIHGMGPAKGLSMRRAVQDFLRTRGKGLERSSLIEGHNAGAVILFP